MKKINKLLLFGGILSGVAALLHILIAHSDTEAVDLKFEVYDFGDRKMLQPIRNRNTRHFALEHALPFKALASKMLNYVAIERNKLEPEIMELLNDGDIEEIISFTQ